MAPAFYDLGGVDVEQVTGVPTELNAALLRGDRSAHPVDLDRLCDAIVRLTHAAALVGGALEALEVNPLWCEGDRVEGLDVRVVTVSQEA